MIFEDKLREFMKKEGFVQTENKKDEIIFNQINGNSIIKIYFTSN